MKEKQLLLWNKKRSRQISEYLSKSPKKGTATWPSRGVKKVLENNHISEITEYSNVITSRQNSEEILPFGLCLSIQTDKCYSWYSYYNPLESFAFYFLRIASA